MSDKPKFKMVETKEIRAEIDKEGTKRLIRDYDIVNALYELLDQKIEEITKSYEDVSSAKALELLASAVVRLEDKRNDLVISASFLKAYAYRKHTNAMLREDYKNYREETTHE